MRDVSLFLSLEKNKEDTISNILLYKNKNLCFLTNKKELLLALVIMRWINYSSKNIRVYSVYSEGGWKSTWGIKCTVPFLKWRIDNRIIFIFCSNGYLGKKCLQTGEILVGFLLKTKDLLTSLAYPFVLPGWKVYSQASLSKYWKWLHTTSTGENFQQFATIT